MEPPSPLSTEPRAEPTLPWLLIAATALVPAVLAVAQLGRIHPDEVYQVLEPAFRRAFGYGIEAWEWRSGLRNWAIPGFFSLLLRACAALGIDHPVARRAVLEVPQFLLHALMLVAVFRYAARRVSAELAGWAVVAVGLYAPVLVFAGRTMGESFSTAFFVLGVVALDDARARPAVWRWGGALLGLGHVFIQPAETPV